MIPMKEAGATDYPCRALVGVCRAESMGWLARRVRAKVHQRGGPVHFLSEPAALHGCQRYRTVTRTAAARSPGRSHSEVSACRTSWNDSRMAVPAAPMTRYSA